MSEKREKIRAKLEKNLMKMQCCVMPCGQTYVGSSQKHFLPFRALLNVGIDPNFPQQKLFFCFFGFIQRKFRFVAKKKLA